MAIILKHKLFTASREEIDAMVDAIPADKLADTLFALIMNVREAHELGTHGVTYAGAAMDSERAAGWREATNAISASFMPWIVRP